MLHHEDPSQSDTPGSAALPAAQVRVTAEELARAIARIQARRESAAQRLEGTLTIGEAVQELNLDAAPEELLAEVQAERGSNAAPALLRRPRRGAVGAGVGLLLLFGSGLWLTFRPVSVPSPVPMSTPNGLPDLLPVEASATTLVRDSSGARPVLRTLAEIPDSRPVRAALQVTTDSFGFVNFSDPATSWTLIKHDGRVYVRAWIAAMSPKALHVSAVNIYRDKSLVPSGVAPQAVTLPVDGIDCTPGDGDDDLLIAQNVRTDSYFSEPWQTTQK